MHFILSIPQQRNNCMYRHNLCRFTARCQCNRIFFWKTFIFFSSCISTNISQHSLRHKPPFEPPHHRRLCFVVSLLFLFVLNASSTVCCVSPTLYSLLNESFFFSFRLHHSHHFIISQMRLCWSFFCVFVLVHIRGRMSACATLSAHEKNECINAMVFRRCSNGPSIWLPTNWINMWEILKWHSPQWWKRKRCASERWLSQSDRTIVRVDVSIYAN